MQGLGAVNYRVTKTLAVASGASVSAWADGGGRLCCGLISVGTYTAGTERITFDVSNQNATPTTINSWSELKTSGNTLVSVTITAGAGTTTAVGLPEDSFRPWRHVRARFRTSNMTNQAQTGAESVRLVFAPPM